MRGVVEKEIQGTGRGEKIKLRSVGRSFVATVLSYAYRVKGGKKAV